LGASARSRQRDRQARRRHLVLPDRRLVFGHAIERDTEAVVLKSGGKVLGKVRHPFPGTDFARISNIATRPC
jgi:hypothetical protein